MSTHKFILDMKFRIGDKVKKQPKWKDDTVYEVYGFEYHNHANGQCIGIMYQLLAPNGEYGNWTREDALELYHEPISIPITEEEMEYLARIAVKNKATAGISMIRKDKVIDFRNGYYFLNPLNQCWEEWSEKLEREWFGIKERG